jgi:DnaD/phage-associated family protein
MQNEKKYILPPPENITLSCVQADAIISAKQPNAALLYLYILRSGGTFSALDAQHATGLSFSDIQSSLETLRKLKLVANDEIPLPPRADEPPEYTSKDVAAAIELDSSFSHLIVELQKLFGRVLSSGDLMILYGIYDYLGLPTEVILVLAHYWIARTERRYGQGSRPTMRTMEKEAYNWTRLGIFNLEAADAFLREAAELDGALTDAKRVLQIYRGLTPTQENYLTNWITMGFKPETLEIAYDRTVTKTGDFSWAYANKIILDWHSKNLHTPSEIEHGDPRNRPAGSKTNQAKRGAISSQTPDDAEIQRLERMLAKQQSKE